MGRTIVDETGNVYGKLTVDTFDGFDNQHNSCWICKCQCGNSIRVRGSALRSGSYKSCGCQQGPHDILVKDETGNRYGKLTVLRRERVTGKNRAFWLCQCDCGNTKIVMGASLRDYTVKSCGCLAKFEYGEAAFNQLYGGMSRGAKARNITWNLNKDQVKEITKQNCYYCGKSPQQRLGGEGYRFNGEYIYNGIDRVDNSRGYEIDNVVPCCGECNTAKNNLTVDQFKNLIKNIYEHWLSGPHIKNK